MSDLPRPCCPDGDRARDLIVLETTGELRADDALALDAIVARCPECRAARGAYAHTAVALDRALAAGVPHALGSWAVVDDAAHVDVERASDDGRRASAPTARVTSAARRLARAAAIAAAMSAAVGAGYVTGARRTDAPAPLEAHAAPRPLTTDPTRPDPRVDPPRVAAGSTDRPDPTPPVPPERRDPPPTDAAAALDTLCRREVDRLAAPDSAAAARAFLGGPGRGWLVRALVESSTPPLTMLDAARAALAPLAPAETLALVGHPDRRVVALALDLGAHPESSTAHDPWWQLAASDDAALAGRVADLLLELGLAAFVGSGDAGDAVPPRRPIASWPRAFADRALAHRDGPRALAQVAGGECVDAPAARALLARLPDATVLALTDHLVSEGRLASAPREPEPGPAGGPARGARALVGLLADRPAAIGLPVVLRALEVPVLAHAAATALERWVAVTDPRELAQSLIAHDGAAARTWVGGALRHARLLVELASLAPAHEMSRTALVAVAGSQAAPDGAVAGLIERYLAQDAGPALAGATAALISGPAKHRASLWRLTGSADERTRRLGLAALTLAGAGPDDPRLFLERLRDGDSEWNRRVLVAMEGWCAEAPRGAERAAALVAQHVAAGKIGRADALAYATERRHPGWASLVEQSLDSPDARVQAAALGSIERPAGDEAVRVVRRLRRAADPLVRAGAYLALGRVAVAPEVDALRAGLDDPEPAVRKAAVVGLGLSADPKAVQPLLTALGDTQTSIAQLAGQSLESLTAWSTPWPERPTPEALDVYRGHWSRWWNAHREEGQHVWLRAAIDSGNAARRALAARSLARSLDPVARALLDHAWREAAPAERAAWGLGGTTAGDAAAASASGIATGGPTARAWLALAVAAPPELALECAQAALAAQPLAALDVLVRGFGPTEPPLVAQRRRAVLARELGIHGASDAEYARWWLAARPHWAAR